MDDLNVLAFIFLEYIRVDKTRFSCGYTGGFDWLYSSTMAASMLGGVEGALVVLDIAYV